MDILQALRPGLVGGGRVCSWCGPGLMTTADPVWDGEKLVWADRHDRRVAYVELTTGEHYCVGCAKHYFPDARIITFEALAALATPAGQPGRPAYDRERFKRDWRAVCAAREAGDPWATFTEAQGRKALAAGDGYWQGLSRGKFYELLAETSLETPRQLTDRLQAPRD